MGRFKIFGQKLDNWQYHVLITCNTVTTDDVVICIDCYEAISWKLTPESFIYTWLCHLRLVAYEKCVWYKLSSTIINYHQHTAITINYLGKLPQHDQSEILNYHQHVKYFFRLQYGKYGYNWFNLESKSRSNCPSISCTSFTSREDLEIEISSIVVPSIFVDGNCVDHCNWLPTVLRDVYKQIFIVNIIVSYKHVY